MRLGAQSERPQAQLDGFKSRALRAGAPTQRHLYTTEWRAIEVAAKQGAQEARAEQARWRATAAEGWLTAGREAKRRQAAQLARMSDMLVSGGAALATGAPSPAAQRPRPPEASRSSCSAARRRRRRRRWGCRRSMLRWMILAPASCRRIGGTRPTASRARCPACLTTTGWGVTCPPISRQLPPSNHSRQARLVFTRQANVHACQCVRERPQQPRRSELVTAGTRRRVKLHARAEAAALALPVRDGPRHDVNRDSARHEHRTSAHAEPRSTKRRPQLEPASN